MTKIGIIRCEEHSNSCAGFSCFPALRDKTGAFAVYESVELVGFDTCGGCGRGKSDKIVARAQRLKEKGAEAIHITSCILSACPSKDLYMKDLREKITIPIVEKTHPAGPRPGAQPPAANQTPVNQAPAH